MIKINVNGGQSELSVKGSFIDLLGESGVLLKHLTTKFSEILRNGGFEISDSRILDIMVESVKMVDEEIGREEAEAEKNNIKAMKVIDIQTLKQTKQIKTEEQGLDTLMNAIFPKDDK